MIDGARVVPHPTPPIGWILYPLCHYWTIALITRKLRNRADSCCQLSGRGAKGEADLNTGNPPELQQLAGLVPKPQGWKKLVAVTMNR